MKQIFKSINPKHLFRSSKKSSNSLFKSAPPSFGSSSTSSSHSSTSSASLHHHHHHTRRSVSLPHDDDDENENSSTTAAAAAVLFKFDVASAFQMIDRDGDGKIDRYELKALFNKSLSEEELGEMIKEIDRDGDGCISLDELQAVGSLFETTAREEEDELRAAFDFFDADHDGRISAAELFQGFLKLGDRPCTLEECRRMIEGVDVNKDGFVCFQDFSRMMEVIPR